MPLCWFFPGDILLERQYFGAFFSGCFLLISYHYIYIIFHFCLVFAYAFGVVTITTYEHYYISPVLFCFAFFNCFGVVYIYLVVMLLFIDIHYIIFLPFTLKIFSHKILTFCFKPIVKIVKNILCNGFKRNVNTMN